MSGFQKKKFKFTTITTQLVKEEKEEEDKNKNKSGIKKLDDEFEVGVINKLNKKSEVDEDDEFMLNSHLEKEAIEVNNEDSDSDPLDSFMANVTNEAKLALNEPSKGPRKGILELEKEDLMESYLNSKTYSKHKKIKAIRKLGDDSDEEVYNTAKLIDEMDDNNYDSDEMIKKEIEPLKRVNHNEINYIDITKTEFKLHNDLINLNQNEINELRDENEIQVEGNNIPKLGLVFGHFNLESKLIDRIAKSQYETPTPIQQQCIPIGLMGRDLLAIAQTGSGKTVSYLLPLISHCLIQPKLMDRDGPLALVLVPTRELAYQIEKELNYLIKPYPNLNSYVITGGYNKLDQFKMLRKSIHILIATPGRLIDLIKMKATNLIRVSYIVIDEADLLLEMGFEHQVLSILNNIRPDKQTTMVSATFPKSIKKLADKLLKDPIKVTIGKGSSIINKDIEQKFHILKEPLEKWPLLLSILNQYNNNEDKLMIFVSTIEATDLLCESLINAGYPCQSINGSQSQHVRQTNLNEFKLGKFKLLVATDIACRGLHIDDIKLIINYDAPKNVEVYTHRIGRSGRAGNKGLSITLLLESEFRLAFNLFKWLKQAEIDIPKELEDLAKKDKSYRNFNNNSNRNSKYQPRSNNNNNNNNSGENKPNPPRTHGIGFVNQANKNDKGFIQFKKANQ